MRIGTGRKPLRSSSHSEASRAPSCGSLKSALLSFSCASTWQANASAAAQARRASTSGGLLAADGRQARRRRRDRRLAAACDLDRREGELDAVVVERLLDHGIRLALYPELLVARPSHHLHAHLDGEVAELLDALHLERLENSVLVVRVFGELLADLLHQLSRLLQVAVVGETNGELVDHPVARHVLHAAQLAERHHV